FKYSSREGTAASKFNNQIHGNIKQTRSETLISLGDSLMNSFNEKFIGEKLQVLFEESSKEDAGFMEGYTTNYIRVKCQASEKIKGKILPVRLIGIENDFLLGKIEEL